MSYMHEESMSGHTRRKFLEGGAAVVLCGGALLRPKRLLASPWGLPLGLQLYSVRELLPGDYEGTLRRLAELGYKEVEAAGFFHHPAKEVKQAMDLAGLRCVSAHYPWTELQRDLPAILAFHKELGAEYIVCSSPGHKDVTQSKAALTLDDWRWNADRFNETGAKVKAAGLRFGYHNHTAEFRALGGTVPFDELLRLTDPALVTFEMDCGWVTVGGGDPVAYLKRYADRISMLHIKDFKRPEAPKTADAAPQAAELGRGTTDFPAIFKAAVKGQIKHCFVEQEQFDMPPFEALKIDADYVRSFRS